MISVLEPRITPWPLQYGHWLSLVGSFIVGRRLALVAKLDQNTIFDSDVGTGVCQSRMELFLKCEASATQLSCNESNGDSSGGQPALNRGLAMGRAHLSIRRHEHDSDHSLTSLPQSDAERRYVTVLIEENAQLRELVVQLSKLVIKNIVERK
jgi:hypothetical protein